MSLLPQRKKSPEEIAKLREDLGILGGGHEEGSGTAGDLIDGNIGRQDHGTSTGLPTRAALPFRSQRATAEESSARTAVPREPKPVRSLRKSERALTTPQQRPQPDSSLPYYRHSNQELAEIRRREALAMMEARPDSRLFPAHPVIILLGYLSAILGAVEFYFYQLPISVVLGSLAVSLVVASFIGLRKPVSRHHAGFISVISLLVLIFGALHYFPELRHAT